MLVVVDLEPGAGFDREQAGHLTDVLRAALLSTNEVVLIDRSRMSRKSRLQELVRQQTGLSEGLAEIGRELNAGIIIHGNLRRKGKRYYVTLKAVDVETAQIKTQEVSYARSEYLLDDEILKITPELVARLVGKNVDDVEVLGTRYQKLQEEERETRVAEWAKAAVDAPLRFANENKYLINLFAPGFKHFESGNVFTGIFFMGAFAASVNTGAIGYNRMRQAQDDYDDLTRVGLLVLAGSETFQAGTARSADERGALRGRLSDQFLFNYLWYSTLVGAKRQEALANARTLNLSVSLAAFVWAWGQIRDEDDAFFARRSLDPELMIEIGSVYDSTAPAAAASDEMKIGFRVWF